MAKWTSKMKRPPLVTSGAAPPRPLEHADAEFQTKMAGIKRDIKAAREGLRVAKAARKVMV